MAKSRRPLDQSEILSPDELAFLKPNASPPVEQAITPPEPEPPGPPEPQREVEPPPKTKRRTPPAKKGIMAKLMETTEKEPTVRITVDLAESVHRKLSILSARSGRKKADIIRMLLDEAFEGEDLDS